MKRQDKFLKIILLLGDSFLMFLALILASLIRSRTLLTGFNNFFYEFIALYMIWIFIIFALNLYDRHFFRKPIDFFFNVVVFSILAFFIGVTYFYFRPTFGITPKILLLLNVVIFDVLFLLWRHLFNLCMDAKGVKEQVVIIGFCQRLSEILPQIKKKYNIEAVFCPTYMSEQKKCLFVDKTVKTISEISDLKKIVLDKKVTSIIFSLNFYSNENLVKEIFISLPLTLNYIRIEELYEDITKKISLDHLDEAWFLEKISRPEDIFEKSVKRLFDIILSIAGMIVFLIFLPFTALAIKIETHGPVFYMQKRLGKDKKIISIYKFGTMFGNDNKENDKKIWRSSDKSQITRVGKFLRKTHIDELPQAWNLFIGELSFVGPRTEWVELANIFEKEIPFYKQRYLVKPGLFGWAQINSRVPLSIHEEREKIEYDLYYVKNHSLLLDLEIILKSIRLFFF
jgi:exopolysaccharide biosynthesis polyprenyl glycosylphosphotransferase